MTRKIYMWFVCITLIMCSALPSAVAAQAPSATFVIAGSDKQALEITSGDHTFDGVTAYKTGDAKAESEDYDFKGLNAAIRVSNGGSLTIESKARMSIISTDATYASAIFSYGGDLTGKKPDGTTVTVSNTKITTLKKNSGGIMVTGGGIINATSLDITTYGDSSAAIRSDRGGGTITVNGGTYTTNGQGSPAIYSTAKITGSDVTLETTKAQAVIIEGGNSVELTSSDFVASHATLNGKDKTLQAVLIYQSQSGDASNGAGTFTMKGGSITNTYGDIFLVTNTYGTINLTSVDITNIDSSGNFLLAEGQNWGTAGNNGGRVIFNATDQAIEGNIIVDSASRLNMTLSGKSTFTGSISSDGAVKVTVGSGSTWKLTANSSISALSKDGTIDRDGYTLTVNGTTYDDSSTSAGSYDISGDIAPNSDSGSDGGDTPSTPETNKELAITTDSLASATVNKAYSRALKAEGDTPIKWSATGLPNGMTFTEAGKLSGKVAATGSYDITFTATNSKETVSKTLTLRVLDVKPKIKGSVKAGKIDYAYKAEFSDTAGTGVVTWSISDALPKGLSFDPVTHIISGTPTEAFNEYINVNATNTGGTTTKRFKLTIKAIKPSVTFPALSDAVMDVAYSAVVGVTGSKPIEVTLANLPAGMSYDYVSSDELVKLYGTPTVGGKFSLKLTATNAGGKASKTKKLLVQSRPVITTETLADAIAGKSYNVKLLADGSKKIMWSIASGDLPPGMTLKDSTGKFNGKATSYGTFSFGVKATNSYGTDSRSYTLNVTPDPPKIKSSSLKKGKAGSSYNSVVKVSGTAPLTWELTGTLPDNVKFSDGTFSGFPEQYFSGTVTISLTNGAGTATRTFLLLIKAVAPKFATKTLPDGAVGKSYSAIVTATGTPDITWHWVNYPPGLVLDKDTGKISGIPTAPGIFKTKITATNKAKSVNKTIKITIADGKLADETIDTTTKTMQELPYSDSIAFDQMPEVYAVAFEFPEISVDVAGMYDLEAALNDSAPVGAKLYWSANASTPSDDDDIAEFADTSGQEIDAVPESREVIVSVWLNDGVTYKPVIYVKR